MRYRYEVRIKGPTRQECKRIRVVAHNSEELFEILKTEERVGMGCISASVDLAAAQPLDE